MPRQVHISSPASPVRHALGNLRQRQRQRVNCVRLLLVQVAAQSAAHARGICDDWRVAGTCHKLGPWQPLHAC